MPFVDPGAFVALQVVDEDDLNIIADNQRFFNDAVESGGLSPTGAVTAYYGSSPPTGWLLCDGSAIAGQHTALIALVGTNTPDLRGRMVLGDTASTAIGATGGSRDAVVVSHNHTQNAHDHGTGNPILTAVSPQANALVSSGEAFATQDVNITGDIDPAVATNQAAGVSGVDANLPPYLVLSFIIKT